MGMLIAPFRVPYRGMPIIACYQFQAAKLRFFPETTKYFFFFLRNILEKSIIRRFCTIYLVANLCIGDVLDTYHAKVLVDVSI